MQQLELQYFWPLSEQIPLDLDYTDCKPKQYFDQPIIGSGSYLFSNGNGGISTSTHLTASNLTIDVASTTFKVTEKPNIIRRGLLNILGIKWEQK